MVEAATNYRKNGFGDEESANLARISSLLQNVADEEISAGEATDFIISQIKGFNIAAEDSIHIVDAVNQVANEYSLSSGDLIKNLGTVSAALSVGGNEFEQVLGLMVSGTEIMRQSNKVARSLISVQSRLNQILDEESSTGKALTAWYQEHNIAIYDQEGQIRSLYDILTDVNKQWGSLSKNEQAYYLNIQAGANQTASLAAILSNFDTALQSTETALNSTGSAVRENERYMQGLEATVNKFKSAWEAFSNSVVNSDLVKLIINLGTGALKALNSDLGVTATQVALLTGTLTGVISLGSKFIANLLPGVTSVTTAMAGLSAAALPVAAAIAGITTVAIAGYSAWQDYKEVVYGAANALNSALDTTQETLDKTTKSTESTAVVAKEYADRLSVLEKQSYHTSENLDEMRNIVDKLNTLIPDLNLTIDDTTGKLNLETNAIYDQINAWKSLAIQQAYAQQYQDQLSAYAEAQVALQDKKRQREEALQRQAEYNEQYGTYWAKGGEGQRIANELFAGRIPQGNLSQYTKLLTQKQAIANEIATLDKAIETTQNAINDADERINQIRASQQSYLAELKSGDRARASRGKRAQQQKPQAIDITGTAVEGTVGSGYYDVSAYAKDFAFDYSSWLKEQQHALNTGKIQEADYYASLQAMLDKYTDESIISTDERWKAEEAIYKYQKNLSKEQQTAYEKKVKEYQQAAENAAKAAQQEAQAQTTAYKQAFTDWLDEKEYLLNTDQITEQEYYDALKAKNEEYYGDKSEYLSEYRKYAEIVYKWEKKQNDEIAKAAKQAHEDEFDSWLAKMEHALAMGEISEENYYERLKEMSDEYFKGDEEYLEKYWKYEEQYYSWKQKQIEKAAEAEKKAQEEALERQKEKLKLQQQELQTEQDNLNAVISYAQKYSQKQIDDIDERINKLKDEATAIKDNYQDQIDKLKETNDALDDQIEKQKLLEALAKAQQTKKYVFKDGRFQYVDDVDAITSAQEALDNFNRQQSLNERVALLEKQRDAELASNEAAQKALEAEKQRWQDYKDGWANLTDEYEYNQNELIALQQYGIDLEKETWDERIANLNDFKERYAQNVKDLEKLAARLNSLETSGSSSGTIQTATKVDPGQAILDEMKANSQAWWFASTDKEREAIHKRNVELNEMLSKKGTYDSGSGKWSHYAKGTTSARGGLSLVGEKGAELRVLNKGDGVVPAHMTENLMDWGAQKPNDFVNKMLNKGKEVLSNVINVGNVSLPNVQNAKEFVSELKNLAYQAAYSRT